MVAKFAASCLLVLQICCKANAGHFSQWYDDGRPGTDANLEYHTTATTSSWWEAVERGCGTGRVYIPTSDVLPDNIRQRMTSGRSYWIGAIAYSTWKWTDGSSFYKHVGHSTEPLSNSDGHLVDGNSASLCHLKCKGSEPFGLKGDMCFCGVSDHVQMTSNQTEVRCPGNYDERCGNQTGVSVYRSGEITFDQGDKGMCVYAELRRLGFHTQYYLSSCDTSRSAACNNGTVSSRLRSSTDNDKCIGSVCVHHTINPWDEANRTCNLVTVLTSSIKDDLHDAMKYKVISEEKYTYWIGLKRGYVKKWLNGSDYLDSVTPYTADKLCLSTTGTSLFRWEDCSSKLPTICENAAPETTRSTTSSGQDSTLQSIHTGTSMTMSTRSTTSSGHHNTLQPIHTDTSATMTTTTTTTMSVLTSQTPFIRVVIEQTTQPFSEKHEQANDNIGLYYGLGVLGAVAAAVVITLLLVMYKQKRGCFTSASVDPKANSVPLLSMDNALYLSTMDVQTEQGVVLEPSAASNRDYGDGECDFLGQSKRGCANEETGNAVSSYSKDSGVHGGRKDDDGYDHAGENWTVRKDDDMYDHARENGTVRKADDMYDHAGDNGTVRIDDDVYDHAGDNGTVRIDDDVYDHAGDNGTVRKVDDVYDHAGDSGTVRKVDDVYDHAGDNGTVRKVDDVYDHAGDSGTVRKVDDVYDHAGDSGTVRIDDDVNDHAGDSGTVRIDDDVYDHAGDSGTVRKVDDVYDHAGEDSCYHNVR